MGLLNATIRRGTNRALRKHIPGVVVLAGGYARQSDDVVGQHAQMVPAAVESRRDWARRW